MLLIGSHMEKNDNQNLFGQNQSKISPKIAQRLPKIANFRRIFFHFGGVRGAADLGGIALSFIIIPGKIGSYKSQSPC